MSTGGQGDCLDELAELCGLESQYYDNAGGLHVASRETKTALLTAMGLPARDPEAVAREAGVRRGRPWTILVEPVQVLSPTNGTAWPCIHVPLPPDGNPAGLEIEAEVIDEFGRVQALSLPGRDCRLEASRSWDERLYGRLRLPLPDPLSWGYYRLRAEVQGEGCRISGEGRLICAPAEVYQPPALEAGGRFWGLTVPLYAINSRANTGIGDLGDLGRLAAWSGSLGAGMLGLNPLHHPGVHLQDNVSPYYPISRLYKNPLYLALELVPELAACPAALGLLQSVEFQAERLRLQSSPRVDYPAVQALKRRVWQALFDTFVELHGFPESPNTDRGHDFARFCESQGESLRQFATFVALSEFWQEQGLPYHSWQDWPTVYQRPETPAVAEFAAAHPREVGLQLYLQWLLQEQLAQASAVADQAGLPLGLYFDLAVGTGGGGFDTWANPGLFALTADIGAPPDDFNPLGQNWGLTPLIPEWLRDTGYRYVRDMIRQNCCCGGLLRLDHVMGLFRLFWIPRGESPAAGAYVHYPWPEMLAVVALESHRQQVLIIGEDLGTVPPYVREELARERIFSTRLFYFERTWEGAFIPAANYPEKAATAVTTHDLPTLAGYWAGRDLEVREELHLYPTPESATAAREHREADKHKMAALFFPQEADELALLPELPEQLRWRVLEFLAQTPCRLALVSLEDIFGWLDQQNLPGTVDEYPNWRLKLVSLLEEIMPAREPQVLAEIMRRSGR